MIVILVKVKDLASMQYFVEPFLTTNPCHPKHSKSLPVHDMRPDFLQLICNLKANANWFHTRIPFSRFSRGACRNMNELYAKACAISCPPYGRCRPTLSLFIVSLDNITNKG